MLVLWVELNVKPESRDRFIEVATKHAKITMDTEKGDVLRFDVVQDNEDPNTFYYYEIYSGRDAMDRHNQTPHRKAYGEDVQSLLAGPLKVRRGTELVTDAV